ncbi:MAG: hypothetical protein U0744_00190 [Gemmataceae bacterium]
MRTNAPEVLDQVRRCLPPGVEPHGAPFVDHLYSLKVGGKNTRPNTRQFTLLYAGLSRLARTMDLDEALAELSDNLERYLALYAADRVFLHAGVVGWKGQAVVLPGQTFAGKSTLVAALLRAGATYYSDEFAVLDDEGHVHPFPRPLALRKPNGEDGGRCSPEHFGAQVGREPLPIGLVALLTYRKDAEEGLRTISRSRAALQLVPYAYCATVNPERAVFAIAKAVRDCDVLRGTRGEADAMAERLLHWVEQRSQVCGQE